MNLIIIHPEQNESRLKSLGVSLCAVLDIVRKRVDGTCSIRIRVIHNRTPKLYTTKISLSKEEFKRMSGIKPRDELKQKRMVIYELLKKANDIIIDMPLFSFDIFEKRFLNKQGDWFDVFFAFEAHIKELNDNGQAATSSTYITALRSFKLFNKKAKLNFDEVTPRFLNKYELHMKSIEQSVTTISINTRCLRRLYNIAISLGDARFEFYPFGKKEMGKYEVPAAQNIKKALVKEDIKKIFTYKPEEENSAEHFHRDLFLFSYLCNGMNPTDIFHLKYKNIQDGQIIFIRKKIAHKRKLKPIQIEISEEIQGIIDKWGQKPKQTGKHIFNILTNGLTPDEELAKVKQGTKMINKYIKRIAKKVGINESISTTWARHSFGQCFKTLW